jgi:polar amino acid transport system substrate-binding protein
VPACEQEFLMRIVWQLVAFAVFAQLNVGAAVAQGAGPQELRVVTRVLPPMVVQRSENFTGFSIDLWTEISNSLNIKNTFHAAPDIGALLTEVRSSNADVGVGAISITSAREAEFDFSQPIMSAGLQILVRGPGKDVAANPLRDLLSLLISWTSLAWLSIALLLIMVPAHLVWLLERRHAGGIIPTENYFPGIFYALFWAAGTLATQAEAAPRHWLARIVTVLWMFTGVVFVALYTAQLAATLTVQQIGGSINGPEDLAGKRVATTRGSTAANWIRELQGQVIEVSQITEAFQALTDKQVEAVVFDSPVLLYYAANDGKGQVSLVGSPFRKEDYGILFRRGDPLRQDVNVALLRMRENGTYQRLYDKWFGSK